MGMRYAFGVDEPWKTWVAYAKAGWDTIVRSIAVCPLPYGKRLSQSARHPTSRWDCDMYYDPDADQTSGKSYTCHGGFSDGAVSQKFMWFVSALRKTGARGVKSDRSQTKRRVYSVRQQVPY